MLMETLKKSCWKNADVEEESEVTNQSESIVPKLTLEFKSISNDYLAKFADEVLEKELGVRIIIIFYVH